MSQVDHTSRLRSMLGMADPGLSSMDRVATEWALREIAELRQRVKLLDALLALGVDNWGGFEEAQSIAEES